ncbi:hypothetical protein BJ978_000826 [Agromyces terreus]|uniref:Uncharacterized protein n=1 Tax=Agromyces terreus TaxID=424795 RepID=A0A9X2KBH0_9MICO|nr:hypothetical protein [Agromyces terreus]MCP2370150.1 hypothetical protein [Agromyces terreus]
MTDALTTTRPARPRALLVTGVIGGVSATLIIWWAFSNLIAKDYGKPLFRRAIADDAPERAVASTPGSPQAQPAA